jgi:DNA-binding transcriptional LysR family regulator
MNLKNLRYFLSIAETGSLRLSSARLDIGEVSLTRAMDKLERSIGSPLFVRDRCSLSLTRAGRILQTAAVEIIMQAEALPARIAAGAGGEIGHLKVGLTGSALFNPLVSTAIQVHRREKPGIALLLSDGSSQNLSERVSRGQLDAAFVRPLHLPGAQIDCHLLLEEEMVVVLPPAHRLAGRSDLSVTDFHNEPFVMFDRALSPSLYDMIISAFVQAGVTLRIAQQAPQIADLLSLAAAGIGVAVVPSSFARMPLDCTILTRVEGLSLTIPLGIALRSNETRPIVSGFVRFLKHHTQGRPAHDSPAPNG